MKKILVWILILPTIFLITKVIIGGGKLWGGLEIKTSNPDLLKQKWSKEAVINIQPTLTFQALVHSNFSASLEKFKNLTVEQCEELQSSVYNFLLAHQTGAYSDYEKFRFPISDGHFDSVRVREFIEKIKAIPQFCADLDTNDTRAVIKKIWETYGVMGKTYCTSCWKSIAHSIEVEEITTIQTTINEIPDISKSVLVGDNIGGSMTIHPCFVFSPSEQEILLANEPLVTVTVSVIVKDESDDAYPVYIQYYWANKHHKWLPRDIALGYWNEKILFLF